LINVVYLLTNGVSKVADSELIKQVLYYDKKNKIVSEVSYLDAAGIKQGTHLMFHANRRLFSRTDYVDGRPEGEYKEWYDDGTLYINFFIADGMKHGEFLEWDSDGTLLQNLFFYYDRDVTAELIERTACDPVLIKLLYGFRVAKQFQYRFRTG